MSRRSRSSYLAGFRLRHGRVAKRQDNPALARTVRKRATPGQVSRTAASIIAIVGFAGMTMIDLAAQGRGRGGAPAGPARTTAPVDMTGTWVSVVNEDWMWRMRTPAKGDTTSVAGLTPAARQVMDKWDPSMDGRCEAYGVGGLMRMPGRLRISWQDDNTLKIDSDAGTQTRLLRFAPPGPPETVSAATPPGPKTLQGNSAAEWVRSGGAFDAFMERGAGAGTARAGALRVRTTGMLPGWLRRNGVPYSENAVIEEYFTRFTHPDAGDWFVVQTTVTDPQYLTQPFITSSNFKREPNESKFAPTPCKQ